MPGFAFFDFKRNVFECPEFTEILFRALSGQTLQARGDKLLKPVARIVVDPVAFAEVFNFDGDVGHADCLFILKIMPLRHKAYCK